jgi:hypothetical protein
MDRIVTWQMGDRLTRRTGHVRTTRAPGAGLVTGQRSSVVWVFAHAEKVRVTRLRYNRRESPSVRSVSSTP